MRKTKIIATLGPASSSEAAIRELIDAGVDVFRFNFSHGTHESHADTIARVRQAATQSGRMIALLQDLSGPKIRTGRLRGHDPVPENLELIYFVFSLLSSKLSASFASPVPLKAAYPG